MTRLRQALQSELDRVDAVFGHGLIPPRPAIPVNSKTPTVRPQGRTPVEG
jgi:hypothetical protein